MSDEQLMDKLTALCKRRGFIFQTSEIYGGLNGFWDYGPLGVELKKNIKDAWWQDLVTSRDDIVGLDSAIIMNPRVWEASGHVSGFTDPMVDCTQCKSRFRADQFDQYIVYPLPVDLPDGAVSMVDINTWMNWKNQAEITSFIVESGGSVEAIQTAARRALDSKRAKVVTRPERDNPALSHVFITDGDKTYFTHLPTTSDIIPGYHKCPLCGGELTEPRKFNLMLQTHIGAMEDSASLAYLRPETAQGIFANFRNVVDTTRIKLPFGIAQIGKAFRNEINPRNYTFRSREFEQMEIEFFCHPSQAAKWYEYWRDARYQWYLGLGLTRDKLHLRDHAPDELAHYARACADIEYDFPFGVSELEGIANRTDYDLTQHQNTSGKDLRYFDDQARERFIPYVIEPSAGVDRTALALLCQAYTEDTAPDEKGVAKARTVMRFHPRIAPTKVAVFPLVKRDTMPDIAGAIYQDLRHRFPAFYDEKGAIGRRYRRQDEAGTPFCVTIDGQTLEDATVTVRDRDTLRQERIDKSRVLEYLQARLAP